MIRTARYLLIVLALSRLFFGCKKEDSSTPEPVTTASQTDLLVAHNWRTVRVSTPDGQIINPNRLSVATQVLYVLNMEFRSDGSVRALDPSQSNGVVNGGNWTLAADNKSMDVDVTGFKGNFPIIELTKNKLTLRQQAPVDGTKTDINLEFEPAS